MCIRDRENGESGFEIIQGSGGYVVFDVKRNKKMSSQELISTYIDQIRMIGCESIENDFKYKDLVINSVPHAILEIGVEGKPMRKIIFYPNTLEGDEDKERMFVYCLLYTSIFPSLMNPLLALSNAS